MILDDPEIEVDLLSHSHLDKAKFETTIYDKDKHHCLDGFPKNGNPCVIILDWPMWDNVAYMGIRPSVLVISDDIWDTLIRKSITPEVPEQEPLSPDVR